MRNGKAHDLLRQLTKGVGNRLAGSTQYNKAVQWGESTLKTLGADKVVLQACMMPNWKRGGKDVAAVVMQGGKKTNRTLDVLALGNSMGSGGKPIVAEVVAVQDFDEMEAKKDQLKGKIVYFNNQFNAANIQTFKSYGEAGQYTLIRVLLDTKKLILKFRPLL